MFQEGIGFITDTYQRFDGTGSYFLLFYVALFYVCYRHKENRALLVYSSLFLLAIILNPFCAQIIGNHFIEGFVYWRCFWLLPFIPVIAFAATSISLSVDQKKIQILIASVCVILIILSGGFMFIPSNYQKAENPYKLPMSTIDVSTMISEDSDSAKALVANEQISYVRQFDPSIKLAYGRYPSTVSYTIELTPDLDDFFTSVGLYFEINKDTPDIPLVVECARKLGVNYYVWYNDSPVTNELISLYNMRIVGQTEEYTVLADDNL